MSPIDGIALFIVVLGAIKLALFYSNPKPLVAFAKKWYNKQLQFPLLILWGILLYFLLQEMTITQIVVCMLFMGLFLDILLVGYGREAIKYAEQLIKKDALKNMWLGMALWLGLSIWVIVHIFL